MKIATIEEAIEKYGKMTDSSLADTAKENRLTELLKLTKNQLADMIISLEAKNTSGIKVGDLAKMILQDEEFITLSNGDVATVVRELIPGSNTSHKSIASYVSKKRDDWNLPDRILIRRRK